ncbi:hypothetical protein SESBI_25874 [Sesbania bispinosa]|nr:hypothetical protein SESBI_25874 [Sesbania bispinosa]
MKLSELEARGAGCKEHPNNKQLPGVCSFCLRDKLLKLCNNKPTYLVHYSPSASTASSNYVSPAYHRRHTSSATDSVSSMISFHYGLKKSKSMIAFASSGSQLREREVIGDNKGSKKGSFWSKLLKLTRKETKEAFMHSRTMRERKG